MLTAEGSAGLNAADGAGWTLDTGQHNRRSDGSQSEAEAGRRDVRSLDISIRDVSAGHVSRRASALDTSATEKSAPWRQQPRDLQRNRQQMRHHQ